MFLHLSVILSTGGGCLLQCKYTPPRQTPLLLGRPPWARHPPGQTPPWADTPWADTLGQTPPGQKPPWAATPPSRYPPPGGHCSPQYVSYWNVFLFIINLCRCFLKSYFLLIFVFRTRLYTLEKLQINILTIAFKCVAILLKRLDSFNPVAYLGIPRGRQFQKGQPTIR